MCFSQFFTRQRNHSIFNMGRRKKKKNTNEGEPEMRWEDSKAKEPLREDLKEGRVPRVAKDPETKKSTMKLKDIYNLRPEYQEYDYKRFSSRLASLRKTVNNCDERMKADQEAFDNFLENHPNRSFFSHHGYEEWQGSDAQKILLAAIEKGDVTMETKKYKLWMSKAEYYEVFPLKTFRDKVYQEFRTAKYLHTLEVRGRDPRLYAGPDSGSSSGADD